MPKILLQKSFWGLRVHMLFCVLPLLLSSFFSWSQTLTSCPVDQPDIVYPVTDIRTGNGHFPYRFHHKDGSFENTFYKDETIYSYSTRIDQSCRSPAATGFRTPIMPSEFLSLCEPANSPFFYTATLDDKTNTISTVLKKCQVVIGNQFVFSRAGRFKATTTGEFIIPFNNSDGTKVTLTILERFAVYTDCGDFSGNYNESGTKNGKKKFVDSDGNELYFDDTNAQWVIQGASGIAYSVASTDDLPPLTSWQVESACAGKIILVQEGEYVSPTIPSTIRVDVSGFCEFSGIYEQNGLVNDRPSLFGPNDGRLFFSDVWRLSIPGNISESFVRQSVFIANTRTLLPPSTGWQKNGVAGRNYTCDVTTPPTLSVEILPTIRCVRSFCDLANGKYTEIGTWNMRPDLKNENQFRMFYWGGGDPNHPEGWYIADADNKYIFYSNSSSTNPPTSDWKAFSGDGVSCRDYIGVFENECEPCPEYAVESIAYRNTTYCKSVTEATATIIGSTGGTFTSTSGLRIDAQSGAINPSESVLGTYTITYSLGGTNGCDVISATTTVTIEDQKTPTISLDASGGTSITPGTSVTFTAILTNGGTAPTYVWKKNDTVIPNETGVTYTASDLANGDKIKVEMTSNDPCASPTMATSNEITMVVTSGCVFTPQNIQVVYGTNNEFGGTYVPNGTQDGAPKWSSPTISIYWSSTNARWEFKYNGGFLPMAYNTTGSITNLPCTGWVTQVPGVTIPPALSGGCGSLTGTATPSITLAVDPSNSITTGTSVTFTATPTNGGTAPTYVWKKNDSVIPNETGATYTASDLANGDKIKVEMTSNDPCASPTMATSNEITMVVTKPVDPCAYTPSNITIAYNRGGLLGFSGPPQAPAIYTPSGTVNGAPSWSNTFGYVIRWSGSRWEISNTGFVVAFTRGESTSQQIPCSSANWSVDEEYADGITLGGGCGSLGPQVSVPTVSISPAPGSEITLGTSVTFTATPTNGGATPSYVWKKNDTIIPNESGATYTASDLADGDKIKVEMTSTDPCANPSMAVSNEVTMVVTRVLADYQITTDANTIVITDLAGKGDVLRVNETENSIQFSVRRKTFSLNGGPASSFPAILNLAGITSITIETNAGEDEVNFGGFTTPLPSLTIKGSSDNETVRIDGNLTFLPDANLQVDLQTNQNSPGNDRIFLGDNRTLQFSGSGSATFKVSQNIQFNSGAKIITENGSVVLEANQQPISTSGDFTGILLGNSTIDISGSGILQIKGKSGIGGDGKNGISIGSNSKLSGGTGQVEIIGQGGFGTGFSQLGFRISENSTIESKGGNISILGRNEATADRTQYGVSITDGAMIKAGGLGTTRVEGIGGLSADGTFSGGIRLADGSTISSSGGKVTVIGTGRGNANTRDHNGIRISGGIISAGGNGDVEVIGTATQGASAGVRISDNGGMITSEGGDISVTGTGSGSLPDIQLTSGGMITSTLGSITVNGITHGFWPNTSGADVRIAPNKNLTLGTGTKLNIDIDGTTVDEQYQQLFLVGKINLNNAILTFEGSTYTPTEGDVFTIVQNDETDPIEGTFAGLVEGATLSNFLGSGLNAFISYTGGDGNDVVISVKTPCITPSAPTASAQSFCGTATVANLVATGTTIQWYAAETGGTVLTSTTALATGTYYASQTVDGCESPRTSVAVTLNSTASAPIADAQSFCGTATVANLVATGTGLKWYASATGGEPLATTTELTSGTYFVSQTVNGCESTRTSVAVTLNAVALPPTASAQGLCGASTVSNLVATGSNLKWYTTSAGGEALAPTASISTGTYYVSQTLNTCESVRTTVEVTVNTQPITLTVSSFSSPSSCTSVDGSISFSTSLPNGSYDLSYLVSGESKQTSVSVSSGVFSVSSLKAGNYGSFSLTFNGCTGQVSGPVELKDPSVVGGTVSGSTSLISGINSGALFLTGHTGQITKWQSSRTLDFTEVMEHPVTAPRFEIVNLNETRYYRAVVEGLGCPAVFSSVGSMTVVQNQAPIASCKNITKEVDNLCSASVTAEELDNGSFDPEGGALVLTVERMGPFSVGQYPLQVTFRDPNGLSSQCFSTLTVVDRMAPWVVTKSAEIFLDANGRAVLSANQVDAGSSDNCGIRSVELSKSIFTCSDAGMSKVLLIVTDLSGNQSSAEATVFVQDFRPPIAVTNPQTVYLNSQGKGSLDVAAFSRGTIDNCGIAEVSVNIGDLGCEHLGSQLFTLTVRDLVGNISRLDGQVTVLDTIAPRISLPNVVLFANASGEATLSLAQANAQIEESCGIERITFSQTNFSCGTLDEPVVISARDRQGNVGFARFMVTVRDTLAPVIQTRPLTVYLNEQGLGILSAQQVDNGTADNCGLDSVSISQTQFDCKQVDTQTITFTAMDRAGNTSRSLVNITVRDTLAPIVRTIPARLFLDTEGQAQLRVADIDTGSTDNCEIASRVIDRTTLTCTDLGVQRVIYRVTDVHGNVGIDTLSITVLDTIAPVLTTQPVTLTLTEEGGAVLTADQVIESATDNCGVTVREVSRGSFACSSVGMNRVTVTVRDASGNQTQRIVEVEVVDATGVCPCSYAILASEEVELENNQVNFGGIGTYGSSGRVTIQNSQLNKKDVLVRSLNLNVDTSSAPDRLIQKVAPRAFDFEASQGSLRVFRGRLWAKRKQSTTETEDKFGAIRVRRGATLTLTSSVVDARKIVLSRGSTLNVDQKTVLRVAKAIRSREGARWNTTQQSLKVFAGGNLLVDQNNQLNGYFHTQGEAFFQRNRGTSQTVVKGTVVGQRVRALSGVVWDGGVIPCREEEEEDREAQGIYVSETNQLIESQLQGEGAPKLFEYGPNPTESYVVLTFYKSPEEKLAIRIHSTTQNVSGLVQREWISERQLKLDVSGLVSGLYVVQVRIGEMMQTVKIIKN